MQADMKGQAAVTDAADEDLIDTLIAISVVAKRLARNLYAQKENEGDNENEQDG